MATQREYKEMMMVHEDTEKTDRAVIENCVGEEGLRQPGRQRSGPVKSEPMVLGDGVTNARVLGCCTPPPELPLPDALYPL